MRAFPPPLPPSLNVLTSWRELWRSGAFAQLDLTWDTNFGTRATERGFRLGLGQEPYERLDFKGALQPIAFAEGGNPPEVVDLSPYEERMTFREERQAEPWSTYAWNADGHPHTSALYSPWQLLYVDDVLEGGGTTFPLEALLAPEGELQKSVDSVRGLLEGLQDAWTSLDASWRPLMKLLVRVQNRYLPEVTGRTVLLFDPEASSRVDPWRRERAEFDAHAAVAQLGLDAAAVSQAYFFLVERGIDREPRDGMELLRRARPRSSQRGWRGVARRAQDHYVAAQTLRLLLTDLTGEQPGRTPHWPMDGRQAFRAAVYDRGPVPFLTRAQLKAELIDVGLYPHAVHVVGEGRSEREMVSRLVAGLLGARAAAELGFTDLGGSGSASRLPTMVSGFTTYAQRTVLVVDSEGDMARYATGLERSGELPAEDILRFDSNLEDSNFTPDELISVLAEAAANPPAGRPPVELRITEADLLAAHETRRRRAAEDPGLAGTLLKLAEEPEYGGPVRLSKPEFAEALADRMLTELGDAEGDETARRALLARRPLLAFTLERIVPPLMGPAWR